MATVVRRCTRCGNADMTKHWESLDEAARAGAMQESWACPSCAWPEAELVEMSAAAPRPSAERKTGEPELTDEGRTNDPEAPVSPDEARRKIPPVGLPH